MVIDDAGKEAHRQDQALKALAAEMGAMQEQYGLTWDACRKEMIRIQERYGVGSVFALSQAEDVWSGVEQCLYCGADRLHFHKRGDLPAIRAKQQERGILFGIGQKDHMGGFRIS